MTRAERQGAILRLVGERVLSTQSELADALAKLGFDVAQTTVSRDIRELGLVKRRSAGGRLVYSLSGTADRDRLHELRSALRRWGRSIEASGNLVVVLTPPGYASAVSQAIDESDHPHVLATIGGENTVLVVASEGVTGAALRDELRGHLLKGAA